MIWLIGSGPMAQNYAKVLNAQKREWLCVGRGEVGVDKIHSEFNVEAYSGGVDAFLLTVPVKPTHAIVATNIEFLANIITTLIKFGVKNILVEKPAAIYSDELDMLCQLCKSEGALLYVAYNRRFYESVDLARKNISDDGGITSLNYEITEWSHEIEKQAYGPGVKECWFLSNTSHVVDLAFFIGGKPNDMSCFHGGKLPWHKRAAIFSGAGVTEFGAVFNYHGNWAAPGRWSLEVLTKTHRYIFRPLEGLKVQQIGSIEIVDVDINYKYDNIYKPGVYLQTLAFLEGETGKLCTIEEHVLNTVFYKKMANYR